MDKIALITKLFKSSCKDDHLLGIEYLKEIGEESINKILKYSGEVEDEGITYNYVYTTIPGTRDIGYQHMINNNLILHDGEHIFFVVNLPEEIAKKWGWKKYEQL